MENKRDQIVYAVLLAISIVGILYTNTMPTSAAKYPKFVLFLILGLSMILLVKSLILHIKMRKTAAIKNEPVQKDSAEEAIREKGWIFPLKEWGVIAIAIAYVILMRLIGFLPASLLAFVSLSIFVGYRKWLPLAIVTVLSVALTYFLFFKYLNLAYIDGLLLR